MKKIIYLLIAILTVSVITGCGCTGKKPHPNVILTTEEPAPDYCGSWVSSAKGGDGKEYNLALDLNPDGSGRYTVTSTDGAVVTDAQGDWSKNNGKIFFDCFDTVTNAVWRADYSFNYDGETFELTLTRGKVLLEGTDGDTIVFTRP